MHSKGDEIDSASGTPRQQKNRNYTTRKQGLFSLYSIRWTLSSVNKMIFFSSIQKAVVWAGADINLILKGFVADINLDRGDSSKTDYSGWMESQTRYLHLVGERSAKHIYYYSTLCLLVLSACSPPQGAVAFFQIFSLSNTYIIL